jgi:hypothetical protein
MIAAAQLFTLQVEFKDPEANASWLRLLHGMKSWKSV